METKSKYSSVIALGLNSLIAVGVLATLAQSVMSSTDVAKIATETSQIKSTLNQAGQSQMPIGPDDIKAIMARPEGDCLRSYVQKSLAAGQVILRGQVQQGMGLDACQLVTALEVQKQAFEASKSPVPQ